MKRRKLRRALEAERERAERLMTVGCLLARELGAVVAQLPAVPATAERLRSLDQLCRLISVERLLLARGALTAADDAARALTERLAVERGPGLRLVRGGV